MFVPIIICAILVFSFIAYLSIEENTSKQTEEAKEHIQNITTGIIKKHTKTLYIKSQQLITTDEYGIADTSKWNQELAYFFQTIIVSNDEIMGLLKSTSSENVSKKLCEYLASSQFSDFSLNEIFLAIENYESSHSATDAFNAGITPAEFESACSNELMRAGWAARTVGQTGDQGADVIAEKSINGKAIKLIIQCKLYSSQVGNAAVQEAFSAKQHYYADIAAVVTNQSYTRSAKELSNTTGVFLLHHDDLFDFGMAQ